MTKLKTLWFVIIPLAVGACTAQWQLSKTADFWDLACSAAALEEGVDMCGDMPKPFVVETKLLKAIGALGAFVHGERWLFVLPTPDLLANGVTAMEVRFHEAVHYIYWYTAQEDKAIPGGCESEAMARKLTAKQFGKEEDPLWRVRYGCAGPAAIP